MRVSPRINAWRVQCFACKGGRWAYVGAMTAGNVRHAVTTVVRWRGADEADMEQRRRCQDTTARVCFQKTVWGPACAVCVEGTTQTSVGPSAAFSDSTRISDYNLRLPISHMSMRRPVFFNNVNSMCLMREREMLQAMCSLCSLPTPALLTRLSSGDFVVPGKQACIRRLLPCYATALL